MSNFRNFDRDTAFPLPPSVDDWLPEKHLARFIMEVVDAQTYRRKSKYEIQKFDSWH